ncbi:molybdopterin-guanine dinucleotide biosynthesis protein MobB [Campylobacterota bacterium]|nr:molybdopterin-guanine dinucleotide biosynthesis protein MobB [Campylobacterota bacterium]
MRRAVAFTGESNSGKTTLIVKLATLLTPTHRVAIVKNDPKDKAQFDTAGKDSYRFFATGADVAVLSPTRTTLFSHSASGIDRVIALFDEFDYLFVEGQKHLPLPRIAIFRESVDATYFDYAEAVAIDGAIDPIKSNIPNTLALLDLNNTQMVLDWIDKNAKEV